MATKPLKEVQFKRCQHWLFLDDFCVFGQRSGLSMFLCSVKLSVSVYVSYNLDQQWQLLFYTVGWLYGISRFSGTNFRHIWTWDQIVLKRFFFHLRLKSISVLIWLFKSALIWIVLELIWLFRWHWTFWRVGIARWNLSIWNLSISWDLRKWQPDS